MDRLAAAEGDAKAGELRALGAIVDKTRSAPAEPCEAPPARSREINLDAARMELEQRLAGLVERWGDPFGDDPTRPLLLPAPAGSRA